MSSHQIIGPITNVDGAVVAKAIITATPVGLLLDGNGVRIGRKVLTLPGDQSTLTLLDGQWHIKVAPISSASGPDVFDTIRGLTEISADTTWRTILQTFVEDPVDLADSIIAELRAELAALRALIAAGTLLVRDVDHLGFYIAQGLVPDPDHPGYYLTTGLIPDPDNLSYYLIGA